MNYFIEKHDMQIILDALSYYYDALKNDERLPTIEEMTDKKYTLDDIDGLFQSFDNSFSDSTEDK